MGSTNGTIFKKKIKEKEEVDKEVDLRGVGEMIRGEYACIKFSIAIKILKFNVGKMFTSKICPRMLTLFMFSTLDSLFGEGVFHFFSM